MNRIILTLIFLVLQMSIALADNFQLTAKSTIEGKPYISYVSNTKVTVFQGNRQVFTGYTDRYGRIIINISRGPYQLRFTFKGQTCIANIQFDGSKQFKPYNWTLKSR
jgi:hypothetical protein